MRTFTVALSVASLHRNTYKSPMIITWMKPYLYTYLRISPASIKLKGDFCVYSVKAQWFWSLSEGLLWMRRYSFPWYTKMEVLYTLLEDQVIKNATWGLQFLCIYLPPSEEKLGCLSSQGIYFSRLEDIVSTTYNPLSGPFF